MRSPNEFGATSVLRHAHAPEPPSPIALCETFFAAGAEERRLILVNLAYVPPPGEPVRPLPKDAARRLEMAALAHRHDAFVRGLEQWLGVAAGLATRIVRDPLGEPIVVAAKVLDLAPETLQRILLFLNPAIARSVRLVHELSTLFDVIEVDAARTLVGLWRAAHPRPPRMGRSLPLHAESPGVRRFAPTPTARPARGRDKSTASSSRA